jgi:DNA-binding winged helix-turn-helix (wHTH) protein
MMNAAQSRGSPARHADLAALFAQIGDMKCVSVVGVSNLGKSVLLRSMTDKTIQATYLGQEASGHLFVYIDFNQMLEMTEQAFYELILRSSIAALRDHERHEEVLRQVETAYSALVAPARDFEVPLRFAQAMAAIGDLLPERVILLMDELDGPVAEIDGRVFLNLRALKDRHWQGLTYVTATNRRFDQIDEDADVSEFGELFAHQTLYISPLNEAEIGEFVSWFGAEEDVTFSSEDLSFVRTWAGGHPGLLAGTCRVLGKLTGRPVRDLSQDWIIHRRAAELLAQDVDVQTECRKIWNDLTAGEQEALLSLQRLAEGEASPDLESVIAKHLVAGCGPERCIFARAFADFVERQHAARKPRGEALSLDPESGEVWINGHQIPTLTNLEYRLLLLLYGRLGKICTKYEVVEAVWGEDYIDEVDDARIEKLVSRLRQKIEPDVATPHYLITVRGRGYRLMGA